MTLNMAYMATARINEAHATLQEENSFRYHDHASAEFLCLVIQRCLCMAWGFAVQPCHHCQKYLITY